MNFRAPQNAIIRIPFEAMGFDTETVAKGAYEVKITNVGDESQPVGTVTIISSTLEEPMELGIVFSED